MLLLVALTREPHLAVDPLVLQHVHDIVEQFPTVPADQDVRIACRSIITLLSRNLITLITTECN